MVGGPEGLQAAFNCFGLRTVAYREHYALLVTIGMCTPLDPYILCI